jgi:hypothetical protein
MSKKVVEVTQQGFNVKPDPAEQAKKDKAKSANQSDRIEAKLDLLLDERGIKL